MRAAPMASVRRLEHGFTGALRGALDGEFRGVFDDVAWDTPDDAVAAADALPPVVADLLLSATLEAVRNAGRHARGDDLHRALRLRLRLLADAESVTAQVCDDGVGLATPTPASSLPAGVVGPAGARSGLLTHSALMALAGGSLSVRSGDAGGAVVTIRAPRASELGEATAPGAEDVAGA
jgi:signal transduction histidine kinase